MQGSNGENTENRFMDKGRREEGDGKMNGDSSMEGHTLTYAKQTAKGNLLHDAELEPGFCDNLEGWDRGSRGKGHMYTYG